MKTPMRKRSRVGRYTRLFAGIVEFNPEPGIIVKKQPPEPIEEVPPEERLRAITCRGFRVLGVG
jgi:hypothetical protein